MNNSVAAVATWSHRSIVDVTPEITDEFHPRADRHPADPARWYMLLIPCYLTVILFPRSRACDILFSSGPDFPAGGDLPRGVRRRRRDIGPVRQPLLFGPFFSMSEFGHIQVASAFKVTATAADLAFSVILFRKYADLSIVVKFLLGFWLLMVGWLLGVALYFLLRKVKGVSEVPVQLGPFVIA